jgi:hypothetical protein
VLRLSFLRSAGKIKFLGAIRGFRNRFSGWALADGGFLWFGQPVQARIFTPQNYRDG